MGGRGPGYQPARSQRMDKGFKSHATTSYAVEPSGQAGDRGTKWITKRKSGSDVRVSFADQERPGAGTIYIGDPAGAVRTFSRSRSLGADSGFREIQPDDGYGNVRPERSERMFSTKAEEGPSAPASPWENIGRIYPSPKLKAALHNPYLPQFD